MDANSPFVAAGFALVTVLVASPPSASANFKRQHAASCMESSAVHLSVLQDQFLINTSTLASNVFVCSLSEDTAIKKEKVVTLNLSGIDQNDAVQIFTRACIGYSGGTGAECDSFVNNGAPSVTGPFTIAVPHSCWNWSHRLDYAYIQTIVPATQAFSSGISGVYIADING